MRLLRAAVVTRAEPSNQKLHSVTIPDTGCDERRSGGILGGEKNGPAGCANTQSGPDRPHLSERGSAVSIMLPPDSKKANWSERGWRANDLTFDDVAPFLEKFRQGFEPGAPGECWPWQAYRFSTTGYGGLRPPGSRVYLLAHRVAWVVATGSPLTDQLTVDHLCNVRLCVNPTHLEAVTMAENQRRKCERRGWAWGPAADRGLKVACEDCGTVTRRDKMRRHQRNMHGAA